MLDKAMVAKITEGYSDSDLDSIVNGMCPRCLRAHQFKRYRILETKFEEKHGIIVNRVKCENIAGCDWDENVPSERVNNGLEGFFES